MNKNETLVELSEDKDEWYKCLHCGCEFMIAMAGTCNHCPGCGKKIIGTKQGGTTIYEQK